MSKKLTILRRLTSLLSDEPLTYRYDNQEYEYDLSGKVYRGRKFLSASEIPDYALSIMETPRPAIGDGVGYNDQTRLEQWTLNVQGFPVDDKDNPSDPAYLMAAAVEARLSRIIATGHANPQTGDPAKPDYPDAYLLQGPERKPLITAMTVAGTVVLPAQENLSRFAFFYTPIILSLVKDARS